MFKKCLNLSFFERSFPVKNWKPYPIFFQHLVLPIKKRGYLYGIENEIYYDFKNKDQMPKIKYISYFETVGSGVKIHSCTSESYEEAREELVKDLIEIYIEELLE